MSPKTEDAIRRHLSAGNGILKVAPLACQTKNEKLVIVEASTPVGHRYRQHSERDVDAQQVLPSIQAAPVSARSGELSLLGGLSLKGFADPLALSGDSPVRTPEVQASR